MGVRRAVDMVLDLQRTDPPLPICTYGPLIHNPQTLQILHSRGIREVQALEDIDGGTVVIRAHGISPDERRVLQEKSAKIIDATCPRVARVQAVISKHATQGHYCIIVGDEDHPEVRGLMGFATAGGLVIPSLDQCNGLDRIEEDREICVVAQTTQETTGFEQIVELLKKRFSSLHVYNTICDSTKKRQNEVCRMARDVELIVVVGGKGSGNTRRLVKVAAAQGVKALHVETEDDLSPAMVAISDTIGVTAGASTPNWQIRGVIDRLKEIGMSRRASFLKRLRRGAEIAVMTYGIAALAGGGLTAACLVLQGRRETWLPMGVTMLFVFSMHLLNRIQERSGAVRFNTPEIASFYARHRGVLTALGALASLGAIALSYQVGLLSCFLLTGMLLLGGLYTLPVLSHLPLAGVKWRSLKDLPGSKTPVVAVGWGVCASLLPILGAGEPVSLPALSIAFLFAAAAVFWRTALSDLLDLQGDRIVGRETIPILVGVRKTRQLLVLLLVALALLLSGSAALGLVPAIGFLLVLNILIFGIFYMVYRRRPLVNRLLFEGLLDGNLVLSGVVSILYGI